MNDKNDSRMKKHQIGSTTYLVTRSFQRDAKEDAAAKMAKVMQNEVRRLMRDPRYTT